MKHCKDCVHSRRALMSGWMWAKCHNPKLTTREEPKYHLGETYGKVVKARLCKSLRDPYGACTPDAKYFEARE